MVGIKARYTLVGLFLAAGLALVVGWFTHMPVWLTWMLAASLALFGLYGYDKMQAKAGGMRVPEVALHAMALAGGFVGGWLGRWVFHHKTQKPVFTVVLIVSTVLYLGVILYLAWG
jgi:uncharacterized membrane protein YsdA (DUF1294 family)